MIPFTVAPLLLVYFTIAEGLGPSKPMFTMYSKANTLALKSGPRHNKDVKLKNRKIKNGKLDQTMFSVDFGIYHGPSLETQGWSVVRVGREDPTDRP